MAEGFGNGRGRASRSGQRGGFGGVSRGRGRCIWGSGEEVFFGGSGFGRAVSGRRSTKEIMQAHNFHHANSNKQPICNNSQEPPNGSLPRLAIISTDDGRENVNGDYLAMWNRSLRETLLASGGGSTKPLEVAFPGTKKDMDSVLRCLLPAEEGEANWPLPVKELKDALLPCCQWGADQSVESTICFYVRTSISLVEKLRMAAACDLPILLAGEIDRKTVVRIVKESSDDFRAIADGPHSKSVMKIMLQIAATDAAEDCDSRAGIFGSEDDGGGDYENNLAGSLQAPVEQFKEKCGQIADFGPSPFSDCCLMLSSEGEAESAEGDGEQQQQQQCYWVNRAYLSTWSPVFRGMLYSQFSEGNAAENNADGRVPLQLAQDEITYWPLFLTLIHPTYMGCLWRLMPREYCMPYRNPIRLSPFGFGRSGEDAVGRWADTVYSIIFEKTGDGKAALMNVFRLAHRFQIPSLVHFCSMMINAKSGMSLAEKVKLADTYHLPELMEMCLNQLDSSAAVKRMFAEDDQLLADLRCKNCSTMAMLFEKTLQFI